MIKSGKLLGDDTKKTELPENLNWAGESGMSGMSQNAKISGLKNVEEQKLRMATSMLKIVKNKNAS